MANASKKKQGRDLEAESPGSMLLELSQLLSDKARSIKSLAKKRSASFLLSDESDHEGKTCRYTA